MTAPAGKPKRRINDRFFTRAPQKRKECEAAELARDVAAYHATCATPLLPGFPRRTRPSIEARSAGALALARDIKEGAYEP